MGKIMHAYIWPFIIFQGEKNSLLADRQMLLHNARTREPRPERRRKGVKFHFTVSHSIINIYFILATYAPNIYNVSVENLHVFLLDIWTCGYYMHDIMIFVFFLWKNKLPIRTIIYPLGQIKMIYSVACIAYGFLPKKVTLLLFSALLSHSHTFYFLPLQYPWLACTATPLLFVLLLVIPITPPSPHTLQEKKRIVCKWTLEKDLSSCSDFTLSSFQHCCIPFPIWWNELKWCVFFSRFSPYSSLIVVWERFPLFLWGWMSGAC